MLNFTPLGVSPWKTAAPRQSPHRGRQNGHLRGQDRLRKRGDDEDDDEDEDQSRRRTRTQNHISLSHTDKLGSPFLFLTPAAWPGKILCIAKLLGHRRW